MVKDAVLTAAKGAYVPVMQGLGKALEVTHVQGATAPPRARRLRHWLYSLTHVHDAVALVEMDAPWWTYRAIDEVEAWIAARRTVPRVFEYGAGASSVWLARRAAEVRSVEHDEGFAELMRATWDQYPNLTVDVVPPTRSDQPRTPSGKEGQSGRDFTDYVHQIDVAGGMFDLVVVDGRARQAALQQALTRLAPDGLLVFDNSRRTRYRGAIERCGLAERRLAGLTPTLPYPEQTSLLSRR